MGRLNAFLSPLVTRVLKGWPWFSLLIALVSAYTMERTPTRAVIVGIAAVIGWVVLIAVWFLQLSDENYRELLATESPKLDSLQQNDDTLIPDEATLAEISANPTSNKGAVKQKVVYWAHKSSLIVVQSLMQQCLFFSLPFYVLALAPTVGQMVFIGLFSIVALLLLWDPWFERVVYQPVGIFLQAACAFAGLNVALPLFGVSNTQSLWIAVLAGAALIPVAVGLRPRVAKEQRGKHALAATGLVALFLPFLAWLGIAHVVPPAPLELVRGTFGTGVEHFVVSGESDHFRNPKVLACFTAIDAPRGLKDKLLHVWEHDGVVVDRIPLDIRGVGNDKGFRTWSKKQNLGRNPKGQWRCRIETSSGQVLGVVTATVE